MFKKFRNLLSEAEIETSQIGQNKDFGLEQYLKLEYMRR
jgi:hypothetical protein